MSFNHCPLHADACIFAVLACSEHSLWLPFPAFWAMSCITVKPRLSDSLLSVAGLQDILKQWWRDRDTRCVQSLLHEVSSEWQRKSMPSPTFLTRGNIFSLMTLLVQRDPKLHPRRRFLEIAMLEEHAIKSVFLDPTTAQAKAAMASQQILLACSKYRELRKYERLWAAVSSKAI